MRLARILLLAVLAGTCPGCSPPGQPAATPARTPAATSTPVTSSGQTVPPATQSSANPLHSAAEEPLFRFQDLALERIDGNGKVAWRTALPAEKYRQMAVLGQTVLVWGPSNNLRRLRADTGEQVDLTLAAGEVSVFRVYNDILVQSASTGLVGLSEKSNIWHRADLRADAMVAGAGPEDNPVVLLVQPKSGLPAAVNLKDGKDAKFPLPKGTFTSVELDRDSGVVTWLPRVDGPPVHTNLDDGKPL